jgi:hypothetical protein
MADREQKVLSHRLRGRESKTQVPATMSHLPLAGAFSLCPPEVWGLQLPGLLYEVTNHTGEAMPAP